MYLLALAMKEATFLVPFLLFLSVTSLPSNLKPRADVDPCLDETPTLDGPTSDKSAGIGVEFESSGVTFAKEGCSAADTNQGKGKQVADRKDKDNNWKLTADTSNEMAGSLTAEYILNGEQIKIGTGAATAAAAAVSSDLVSMNMMCESHSFHILNGPYRSHGTHTRICQTTNGTSTAIIAIRGR